MHSVSVDILIRIKNGYMGRLASVEGVHSRYNEAIMKVLSENGYIDSFTVSKAKGETPKINIVLRYNQEGEPAITGIKIQSRPGQRIYGDVKSLKPVLGGMGMAILSTSAGVVSDRQAKKLKSGGEVIAHVW